MSHLSQGAPLWNHGNFSLLLWNPRQTISSVPPGACFASQLERCFNASLHELILSCSIFEKIDPSRVFPFLLLSCRLEFSEQDIETKMVIESTFLWSATWIVKIMLARTPSVFLPHVLNLGTRFLFSGGELSQPQISPCLTFACSSCHHV